MIFRQFLREPLAAASYLIGCTATGEAAVVDPGLPAEEYVLFAADKGLRITAILETHLHADYFSTGRALAALTGAPVYAPRVGDVLFEHRPVEDGDTLQIGNITLRALHTPGHTPEHMCYTVTDTPRAERPWFVLTGDCLFVGDVGRADLLSLPQTGPDYLYDSIFNKLLTLPDDTEIFPAHYGGSACGGKSMSGKVSSTIGFEKRFNWALQAESRAAFSELVSTTAREAVEEVLLHRNTNRGELPLPEDYYATEGAPSFRHIQVSALTVPQAAEASTHGHARLVDVRLPAAFAAAHAPGAVNAIYGSSGMGERVALLTEPSEPVILLSDQPFLAQVAADMVTKHGRNPVLGYVNGTFDDWVAAGQPTATLPLVSLEELHQRVTQGDALVLDVREPYEWEKGVIDGARLLPLGEVRPQLATLPTERPIIVICESGRRSGMAASLLQAHGHTQVASVLPDGMSEYASRYPTVAPTQALA